ncbi:hypothetical protein C8R45DRAFT_1103812 [Mycena sanguinolenta]|nr:hypothetical protein C8R45DRAFT_1103812 [Mycena sanguinolenta]
MPAILSRFIFPIYEALWRLVRLLFGGSVIDAEGATLVPIAASDGSMNVEAIPNADVPIFKPDVVGVSCSSAGVAVNQSLRTVRRSGERVLDALWTTSPVLPMSTPELRPSDPTARRISRTIQPPASLRAAILPAAPWSTLPRRTNVQVRSRAKRVSDSLKTRRSSSTSTPAARATRLTRRGSPHVASRPQVIHHQRGRRGRRRRRITCQDGTGPDAAQDCGGDPGSLTASSSSSSFSLGSVLNTSKMASLRCRYGHGGAILAAGGTWAIRTSRAPLLSFCILAESSTMESNQHLRDRLEDINAQIALLQDERETIKERLQSIKYPVLRLPFEVASEIFIQCLPNLGDAHPIFRFSPVEIPIPVLLTQVCRTWRVIALKTPKIWSIFRIDIEAWPEDRSRGTLQLAEWVERAGVSPLSFVLNRQRGHAYQPSTPPAILAPILALAKQWQNFNVCLPNRDLVSKQFQSALHGRLPLLETLQITSDRISSTTVVSAFEMAPSLRRVVLEGIPPTKILLPWKQLTHFSARMLDEGDCLHVLKSGVSLTECKFGWMWGDLDGTTEPLPCRPALKVLHLGADVPGCAPISILALATFPSLEELEYGCTASDSQSFVAFLSRSRPPLLRLSLHDGAYGRIFDAFPFLVHLSALEIYDLTVAGMSDFLRNLIVRDSASFLPNLESFTSSVWLGEDRPEGDTAGIDYGELADALQFRCNLDSFQMTWEPSEWRFMVPPQDFHLNLPRFERLIEEGMDISVIAKIEYGDEETSQVWI